MGNLHQRKALPIPRNIRNYWDAEDITDYSNEYLDWPSSLYCDYSQDDIFIDSAIQVSVYDGVVICAVISTEASYEINDISNAELYEQPSYIYYELPYENLPDYFAVYRLEFSSLKAKEIVEADYPEIAV